MSWNPLSTIPKDRPVVGLYESGGEEFVVVIQWNPQYEITKGLVVGCWRTYYSQVDATDLNPTGWKELPCPNK